jgi:hypothetical protein
LEFVLRASHHGLMADGHAAVSSQLVPIDLDDENHVIEATSTGVVRGLSHGLFKL